MQQATTAGRAEHIVPHLHTLHHFFPSPLVLSLKQVFLLVRQVKSECLSSCGALPYAVMVVEEVVVVILAVVQVLATCLGRVLVLRLSGISSLCSFFPLAVLSLKQHSSSSAAAKMAWRARG